MWVSRLAVVLALVLGACSNDSAGSGAGGQGGGPGPDEDPCCTLGAVCHTAGEAPNAEVDECHQIGHTGDQAVCTEEYDRCRLACEGVTDNPVPHACE